MVAHLIQSKIQCPHVTAHELATISPKPCCLSLLHTHWNLDIHFFLLYLKETPWPCFRDVTVTVLPACHLSPQILPCLTFSPRVSHVSLPVNTVLTTLIELTFLITQYFSLTRYSRLAIFQLYSLLIFLSSWVSWILHFWLFYLFRLIQGELSMLCTIGLSSCTSDMTMWRTRP